ncbi:Tll0287-like domain-containing protein [Leptospira koniambonensis]|uniref:Tll0287-like domain-containing protein n=1 Tax=Leptospira koniambonensis TaxID=2484950 RepID=UPI003EB9E819
MKFSRLFHSEGIYFRAFIICISLATLTFCVREEDAERKAILMKLFSESEESLTKDLKDSIRKKGSLASLVTCRTFSEEKEKNLIFTYPRLDIRRISERSRNPDHLPKDWEIRALSEWKKFGSKENPAFIFSESLPKSLHFMRPIYVNDPVCLKCHGAADQITSELKTEIKRLYPKDRSFGYKLGDLIGAYSASWGRL